MKKLLIIVLVFIFISCKDKNGGCDLTGTVYRETPHGTSSLQLGTYLFTLILLYSAYFLGKISKIERNNLSNEQSFYAFMCMCCIIIYVIFLPILFLVL